MNELTRDKYLLPNELEEIYRGLDLVRESRPYDVCLIEFLLYSGARCSEVLLVTPYDLTDAHFSVYLRGTKSSKDREIPLPKEFYKRLKGLCGNSCAPIFPTSYSTLSRLWAEFCPSGKTPHSARHTFALSLYERHRDIKAVQIALGHRSLVNTQIYTDFVYSREKMRKLVVGQD